MQYFLASVYGQKDPNCDSLNDPCVLANSTLHPCNGHLMTIPPEALSGAVQFQYKFSMSDPEIYSVYYCSCSVKFYNLVVNCTTCFQGPGTSITVEPFQDFANACANAGFAIALEKPKAPNPRKIDKYCGTLKDPCNLVNSTLSPCGGYFPPPTPEVLSGKISSKYELSSNDNSLFPCACNAELYSLLYRCTTCFIQPGNDITVEPLNDFKTTCIEGGFNFEVTSPTTTEPSPTQKETSKPTPLIKNDPSCNTENDPCLVINNLLMPCNGFLYPPSKLTNGSYSPDGKFYDQLSKCMTCFAPKYNITVVPFDEYEQTCKKLKLLSNDGSLILLKDSFLLLSLWIAFMECKDKKSLKSHLITSNAGKFEEKSDDINCQNDSPDNPCNKVDKLLEPCNETLTRPDSDDEFMYWVDEPQEAKCWCNKEFYDLISSCMRCFSLPPNVETRIRPLEDYKNDCKAQNVEFIDQQVESAATEQEQRQVKKKGPNKLLLALGISSLITLLASLLFCLVAFKKNKKKSRAYEQLKTDFYSYPKNKGRGIEIGTRNVVNENDEKLYSPEAPMPPPLAHQPQQIELQDQSQQNNPFVNTGTYGQQEYYVDAIQSQIQAPRQIIAQEPEDTPSPTVKATSKNSEPTTNVSHPSNKEVKEKETTIESCTEPDSACKNVNAILKLCNGIMVTPDKYIEQNIHNGTYQPDSFSLARCMCNQPYYNMLKTCLECFTNITETGFEIAPMEQYETKCKSFGITFTQEMPPPPTTGVPSKVKLILSIGLFVISFGLIGMLLLQLYRRKKRKEKEALFAAKQTAELAAGRGGRLSTDTLTKKYPLPSSSPTHRPPPQYTSSGGTNYPPPPSSNVSPQPYYPPHGSPQGGQGGGQGGDHGGQSGQGGQADSYFNSSF
ncbi:8673_t:CDS:10 [Funneliformis geosporum]|nr:8673_t:CDS:10 [Funneliformis geosporum]